MKATAIAIKNILFNNYTVDAFDRWHGEGTSTTQPRLTVGSVADQWVSTRYMQNADYFKIQNVTLGYDFARLWKQELFSKFRLYVQAQNLFTFTGYTGVDPECSSDGGKTANNMNFIRGIDVGLYPSARTFIIGASITFKGKHDKAAAPAVQTVAAPAPANDAEIDRLNGEINRLRAELNDKPAPIVKEKIVEKASILTYPYFVNFDINEVNVVNRERVNLKNVADMMKDAPAGTKFNVVGYADKATGSAERNAWLAENRAKNVYNTLINEFGVPAGMLVLDSKGGVDDMFYNSNELSRAVIISKVK